jgi:hypothetical protein
MLVDGRHDLVRRALACFRGQTYIAKSLLIFDTGAEQFSDAYQAAEIHVDARAFTGAAIGRLRNAACKLATNTDRFIHWDSDDWSAPDRIAFQADILTALDVEVMGYNSMVFWREQEQESWLYSNSNPKYFLGTSMCYTRAAWEKYKFLDEHGENESEYNHWFGQAKISSGTAGARMIASIHEGNAHRLPYRRELMEANERQGGEWTRTPYMDEGTGKRMKL